MDMVKIKQKHYKKMLKLRLEKIDCEIGRYKGDRGPIKIHWSIARAKARYRLGVLESRRKEAKKEIKMLKGVDQKYMFVDRKVASVVGDYMRMGYSLNDGLIGLEEGCS